MRVYLAGNLHTNWRTEIVEACPDIEFLQPYKDNRKQFFRTEEGTASLPIDWYVTRDLLFVSQSDMLLGYIMEYAKHSRHHGLMIEMGFARALDIPIVLVSEMPIFDMAEGIASVIFGTLSEAAYYMNFLVRGNPI